jgi:hypothetical protein
LCFWALFAHIRAEDALNLSCSNCWLLDLESIWGRFWVLLEEVSLILVVVFRFTRRVPRGSTLFAILREPPSLLLGCFKLDLDLFGRLYLLHNDTLAASWVLMQINRLHHLHSLSLEALSIHDTRLGDNRLELRLSGCLFAHDGLVEFEALHRIGCETGMYLVLTVGRGLLLMAVLWSEQEGLLSWFLLCFQRGLVPGGRGLVSLPFVLIVRALLLVLLTQGVQGTHLPSGLGLGEQLLAYRWGYLMLFLLLSG